MRNTNAGEKKKEKMVVQTWLQVKGIDEKSDKEQKMRNKNQKQKNLNLLTCAERKSAKREYENQKKYEQFPYTKTGKEDIL